MWRIIMLDVKLPAGVALMVNLRACRQWTPPLTGNKAVHSDIWGGPFLGSWPQLFQKYILSIFFFQNGPLSCYGWPIVTLTHKLFTVTKFTVLKNLRSWPSKQVPPLVCMLLVRNLYYLISFFFFFFFFFLNSFFVGHIHMSYFGATGTPVLDFWWRLLWVSKPEWVLPYSHCGGECNVHSLRSTSGATRCRPLDGQHCGALTGFISCPRILLCGSSESRTRDQQIMSAAR